MTTSAPSMCSSLAASMRLPDRSRASTHGGRDGRSCTTECAPGVVDGDRQLPAEDLRGDCLSNAGGEEVVVNLQQEERRLNA